MVSGGKEKILDGNGEEMWVVEKKVKEKKNFKRKLVEYVSIM